jgi:hypothetical protein
VYCSVAALTASLCSRKSAVSLEVFFPVNGLDGRPSSNELVIGYMTVLVSVYDASEPIVSIMPPSISDR